MTTETYTQKVNLVVTDLAGTTADFGSCAPAGAFIELFRRHGLTATVKQARGPMGMHKRDHIRIMTQEPDIATQFEQINNRPVTEDDVEQMFQEFIPLQLECLPNFTEPIAGVPETVQQLQSEGIPVNATTGYNREMMDIVLKTCNERGYTPTFTISAAEVPNGRPYPWMIFECMKQNSVLNANTVVKTGDTISDIDSAHNAGCWSVGITETGNMIGLPEEQFNALPQEERKALIAKAREEMEKAGAHFVVNRFSEVPAVIEQINVLLAKGITPATYNK